MTLEEFNQTYYIQLIDTTCNNVSFKLNHNRELFFAEELNRHNQSSLAVIAKQTNEIAFEFDIDHTMAEATEAIRQKFNINIY